MDARHAIGIEPSVHLILPHIISRIRGLVLKIISGFVAVLLAMLFTIGFCFSKVAHTVSKVLYKVTLSLSEDRRKIALYWANGYGSAKQRQMGGDGRTGGQNGVPEGWVRYVICRTEEISEFDLESCEGCRQVLETEIEMVSGKEESLEEKLRKLKRIDGWLEDMERWDRDRGYLSPEADGEREREILWASPGG